jgi:basic membrane protein A and related proteins
MKKLLSVFLSFVMVSSLVGCSSSSESSSTTDNNGESETTSDSGYAIAVVTDVGQLNDGGFNQGTYEGAVAFAEANGYTYKYYQPANGSDATDDDRIAAMRQAVEGGAQVVVTPGYLQATALQAVAEENPDVKFVFVDGWALGLDNVTAISYHEEESGFFAGYAAVKDGYTSLGGTFGGSGTNAACNRFAYGYVQGIEAAAAELDETVDVTMSFLYGGSFSSSTELQTQISGWYNNGVQVVFACGGSMLQSVKAAAAETTDGKIIGVDVDQASESDRVITSAFKGLSESVQLVLNEWNNGEWDSKLSDQLSNLGVSDNATGLPTTESSWRFETFTTEEYEAIKEKVASGEITISSDCADLSTADGWDSLQAECTHINLSLEY